MARTWRDGALELIDLPGRVERMAWRAQQVASAQGLPDAFIRGIRARRVSDTHWQVVNSWMGQNYHTGEVDVPLGRFFEFGTRDHMVLPVYAKALSWDATGSSPAFPGEGKGRAFSRGHVVRGLHPSLAMTQAVEDGMAELRAYVETSLAEDLAGWGARG